MESYTDFFTRFSGHAEVLDWQAELAATAVFDSRLIRIPTGFGKTHGVLGAWLWHRVMRGDDAWPLRLVWCLPMRVLVEQVEHEIRAVLDRLDLLWEGGAATRAGKVGVHALMGGVDGGDWVLYPEHPAILVGTQDMLLSRALNRGYGSARARWPMEFGQLNQDALWVMDEVQLMDVGLATSVQLQVFRDQDYAEARQHRPCRSWWMSATLQADWLAKSPDAKALYEEVLRRPIRLGESAARETPWGATDKPLRMEKFKHAKAMSAAVAEAHLHAGRGARGPTLVVMNTVDRAVETWEALRKNKSLKGTDIRLVHSRFRAWERGGWQAELLCRSACRAGVDRIIVATQVVEAGVDFSAALLVTELAPWASLVQRFGRCARWGGMGEVLVAALELKSAAPYEAAELEAARAALAELREVSVDALEVFEREHPHWLARLYPYAPNQLLLRHEVDELFDTTADLSGADIDVSRFIRQGDERDLQVFWAPVAVRESPPADLRPHRAELCSVPASRARSWLCGTGKRLKPGLRAWVWHWAERAWRLLASSDLYPGQTVLVEARVGGYRPERGWDEKSTVEVDAVPEREAELSMQAEPCWRWAGPGHGLWMVAERWRRVIDRGEMADSAEDDESLSTTGEGVWQTIATHGRQVGELVSELAGQLVPSQARLLNLAGRWHDTGKAHGAFQSCIQAPERPARGDIAKAPEHAWPCAVNALYRLAENDRRQGFRHELASTLALFGVLQRCRPDHPALLGPWRTLLDRTAPGAAGRPPVAVVTPNALEREILALDEGQFNLLAYLVCAHHGKVRAAWHASPADQAADDGVARIRGVREGDVLPALKLCAGDGQVHELAATVLDLSPSSLGLSPSTGASWTERVLALLVSHGPFTLAWLESLLRAADQRASSLPVSDPTLTVPPPRADVRPNDTYRAYRPTPYRLGSDGLTPEPELRERVREQFMALREALGQRVFADLAGEALLRELHRRIANPWGADQAGQWRARVAHLGPIALPAPRRIPALIEDYLRELRRLDEERLAGELSPAHYLARAEGGLRLIGPFDECNEEVTALYLGELWLRIGLAPAGIASAMDLESPGDALQAYALGEVEPLARLWQRRLRQWEVTA